MFIKHSQNFIIIIFVYVDDIIIIENDDEGIKKVKQYLKKEFDIKELRQLSYFLEIKIVTSSKGLFLSQKKYIFDLLKDTDKLEAKLTNNPMKTNIKLRPKNNEPLSNIEQYKRLIDKLIYLIVMKLNIASAVSIVSQFIHTSHTNHFSYLYSCFLGTTWHGTQKQQNITALFIITKYHHRCFLPNPCLLHDCLILTFPNSKRWNSLIQSRGRSFIFFFKHLVSNNDILKIMNYVFLASVPK
jgi:Reverse transcriptase (RNA-dependent DNA polymerase)